MSLNFLNFLSLFVEKEIYRDVPLSSGFPTIQNLAKYLK